MSYAKQAYEETAFYILFAGGRRGQSQQEAIQHDKVRRKLFSGIQGEHRILQECQRPRVSLTKPFMKGGIKFPESKPLASSRPLPQALLSMYLVLDKKLSSFSMWTSGEVPDFLMPGSHQTTTQIKTSENFAKYCQKLVLFWIQEGSTKGEDRLEHHSEGILQRSGSTC